jgi:hypothetical protein
MNASFRRLCVLIGLLCCVVTARPAEAQFAPGDTIWYTIVVPDSSGQADGNLTDARLYIVWRGAIQDSSKTLSSGISKVSDHPVYKASYVIPSNIGSETVISAYVKYTGNYANNFFPAIPRAVFVGGSPVDTLYPSAVQDLWVGMESNTFGVIDSTDAGGIYHSGSGVTGAAVFVTSDSTLTTMRGFGKSINGAYYIWVDLDPSQPDTFYVSAWYNNSWLKQFRQVVIN